MNANPKPVTFVLLLPETSQHRARLPMRVNINAHNNTESIVTTVKNFYGLHDKGVSFEDHNNCMLIASYDNLERDMTVYVRVVSELVNNLGGCTQAPHGSPRKPHIGEPFQLLPPKSTKPDVRAARQTSASPQASRDRQRLSATTQARARPCYGLKRRGSSEHGSVAAPNGDATNGYSSSDGANELVYSSRKVMAEQLASAEISVDNIVEGGRRKRPKFESSELPLFAVPQIPMMASTFSVSPRHRISNGIVASPFAFSYQHTFVYPRLLSSPRTQCKGEASYWQVQSNVLNGQPYGHRLIGQSSYGPPRVITSGKADTPPTPTPIIGGSVISDEDAASQLMRLGDASCFSSHGRTLTSTADDVLSSKAQVASSNSDEDTDESYREEGSPQNANVISVRGKGKREHGQGNLLSSRGVESSGEEYEDKRDGSFNVASNANKNLLRRGPIHVKAKPQRRMSSNKQTREPGVFFTKGKARATHGGKAPISTTSIPPQPRKPSSASLLTFQIPLGMLENDLSSKPRCQRCRKSKKGCDRQRPCQRCKDAAIGVEGCISEDEGNGRKGRYGRQMRVAVKREFEDPILKNSPTMADDTATC